MSSSERTQRYARKQQRIGDPPTPLTTLNSSGHSAPHPYHENPPPAPIPAQQPMQKRTTSSESKLSDISMDDFAGAALESVLEYSDTSDDMREDSYFLTRENPHSPPSLLGSYHVHRRPHKHHQINGDHNGSGESVFRELKRAESKSSSIVQFSSNVLSGSFSDSDTGDVTNDNFFGSHRDNSTIEDSPPVPQNDVKVANADFEANSRVTWMKKVAFAFRSPSGIHNLDSNDTQHRKRHGHHRTPSGSTMEYAHSLVRYPSQPSEVADLRRSVCETSPLLKEKKTASINSSEQIDNEAKRKGATFDNHPQNDGAQTIDPFPSNGMSRTGREDDKVPVSDSFMSVETQHYIFTSRKKAVQVAAYFLMDYEASRPPTLSSDFEMITKEQLTFYRIHFSWQWRCVVDSAILMLFLSHTQNLLVSAIIHSCVIVIFAIEITMKEGMYGIDPKVDTRHPDRKLVRPMAGFLFFLGLESWMWYLFSIEGTLYSERLPIISSIFKPLVFFYVSSKARESLEALWRISQIVMRVLLVEFFLILTFASVGCRMFGSQHESFHNLTTSWLSLFELSTTVVNPSLWMPIYKEAPSNALFFVVFIITCTFYYHSLVLSVVFQTYIQSVTEIHERSASDREDAIRLSFLALRKRDQLDYLGISSIRRCLKVIRPHYSTLKMKALIAVVDPSGDGIIDYPTFRKKIRAALNASIRTTRSSSTFAMCVELIAVVVAVSNFIYVLMVTSEWNALWFSRIQIVVGSIISILGVLELVVRFNPLRFQHFAPITRLNPFFDGLALLAALVSCVGIIQYAAGYASSIDTGRAVDFLLLGRAIDMIRFTRFFALFRDVVRRSADVLPALAGPLILLLSIMHIFVFFGMMIWGGAIDVELLLNNHEDLTPLYCLNNFNSYTTGLITMFNILAVNDWHQLAAVYLYAERNSRPLIVYSFFVTAICTTVFIMLNVITAFFVESFVTQRQDPTDDSLGNDCEAYHRGFQIRTGENTNVKRVTGTSIRTTFRRNLLDDDDDEPSRASSEREQSVNSAESSGEIFSFDIYEREGFDQIMRTVAGSSDAEQETFARSVCHYFEMFESLTIGRERVGYMICCQQSMNRFGNRRFQTCARGFLSDDTLHKVVSDMHSEVLVLTMRRQIFSSRCLVRAFPHQHDDSKMLEVTATLLRYQPAATLIVARIRTTALSSPNNQAI